MYCDQDLTEVCSHESNQQLEQLERLCSEDTPPPPHDYPHYWVILDPKSKWKPKK